MTGHAHSCAQVDIAFGIFRTAYCAKAPMKVANNDDELKLINTSDIIQLYDGPSAYALGNPPEIADNPEGVHLWVVRERDVVHAEEKCTFGAGLQNGEIKHTNLTGGGHAHCGGEFLFHDKATLIVNGASGRYGPTSEAEMVAVARAFKDSGYGVWYYPYDEESGEAFRFGSRLPEWLV